MITMVSYVGTRVEDRVTKTAGTVTFHEMLGGSGRMKIKFDILEGNIHSEEILVSERGFLARFKIL